MGMVLKLRAKHLARTNKNATCWHFGPRSQGRRAMSSFHHDNDIHNIPTYSYIFGSIEAQNSWRPASGIISARFRESFDIVHRLISLLFSCLDRSCCLKLKS
jgi:hypothetical protein